METGKTITDFVTLCRLARKCHDLKKNEASQEEIEKAEQEHEDYRQICLIADEMIIPKF